MNNFRIEIITILMIRNSRKVLLVFATLWSRRKRKKEKRLRQTGIWCNLSEGWAEQSFSNGSKVQKDCAIYTLYICAAFQFTQVCRF